jgi:hypothetical protein
MKRLTRSALIDLLCRDRKNRQHLHHYFHDHIHHLRRRCYLSVDLETQEKILHALEDINERVLTRTGILSRLTPRCQNSRAKLKRGKHK